jgi:hypothetical protein
LRGEDISEEKENYLKWQGLPLLWSREEIIIVKVDARLFSKYLKHCQV